MPPRIAAAWMAFIRQEKGQRGNFDKHTHGFRYFGPGGTCRGIALTRTGDSTAWNHDVNHLVAECKVIRALTPCFVPKYEPIADRGAEMPNHITIMRRSVPNNDSVNTVKFWALLLLTKGNSSRWPSHQEEKVEDKYHNEYNATWVLVVIKWYRKICSRR